MFVVCFSEICLVYTDNLVCTILAAFIDSFIGIVCSLRVLGWDCCGRGTTLAVCAVLISVQCVVCILLLERERLGESVLGHDPQFTSRSGSEARLA